MWRGGLSSYGAGAAMPRMPIVRDGAAWKSHPGEQAFHETMMFAQFRQRRNDAPAHQPEIPGIRGHRHGRGAADDAIEGGRCGPLEPALAVALPALRIHHVVAAAP